ncbi:MAG TPA: hypothetical protein VGB54_14655 [Allosphingosinicella sp.]
MDRRLILRSVALGLAAMAILVALALLWVLIYAFWIAPGHPGGFYQAYAARVSPLCGLIAGLPVLGLAGYFAARMAPARPLAAAILPAIVYILLDLLLLALFMPAALRGWPLLLLSWVTKAAAAAGGGWLAGRRRQS